MCQVHQLDQVQTSNSFSPHIRTSKGLKEANMLATLTPTAVIIAAVILVSGSTQAQESIEEEPNFAFFELIEEGKVSADRVSDHCKDLPRSFSVETNNLMHTQPHQRVTFSGRNISNVNANPGVWNGSLYKPICPGLYAFNVDFISSTKDGATNGDVIVHLHVWHRGGRERPGELTAMAIKPSGLDRGIGHATVAVKMASGDEFSLFTLSPGADRRHFERIQLTAFRVTHMSELAREFDLGIWEDERAEANATPGALP